MDRQTHNQQFLQNTSPNSGDLAKDIRGQLESEQICPIAIQDVRECKIIIMTILVRIRANLAGLTFLSGHLKLLNFLI